MTRQVVIIPPSLSIANAWSIMQSKQIRHLPVVQEGKIVGILSDRDLLRIAHTLPSGELGFIPRSVADIMTLTPIVCAPDASVASVATIMTEEKIDALPVVANGRLIGLVTSTDLMQLLIDREELPLPFDFQIEAAASLPS